MSKIALSGNASGTGTLTIAAPNTNSDFTLSLPATTAPILAGSGITLSASAPANTLVTTDAGNVGIGTSSPGGRLEVQGGDVIVKTTDSNTTKLGFKRATPFHGDQVTGAIHTTAATVGFSDGGGLAFATMNGNNSGTASLTDRVFIDDVGNLLVGRTNSASNAAVNGCVIYGSSAADFGQMVFSRGANTVYVTFRNASSGAEVGNIQTNGTTTSYVTSSDYRLKHDIQPMTGALAKVAQLKPVTYKWNADDSESQGFIAHELQEVVPECVSGEKDAVNGDGSIKPQGIDTSFLVATLTAAIQELNAKVDAQAAEIAALKGQA